jgi:peptide/nickel transport system permease protein
VAALGWGEVFFMVLWLFVLGWPLWNRLVNRALLGGDRVRIRRARRAKWAVALGASALAGVLWKVTVDGHTTIDVAPFKSGITSGEIVAKRAIFPPLSFGFAETNSGEYFRPPTWKSYADIDETGYYMHGARRPEADVVTGVLPNPAPVQVRYPEPQRNQWTRHLVGTDRLGRDLLVRALYGGRISLSVGLVSAALLVLIGTFVGALAGYYGGWVDFLLSRLIELLICIPPLFLILMVLSFIDPKVVPPILAVVAVIGCFYWTGVARLARGEFLKLREQEFVVAARALGISSMRTIFRHVLPNAMGPILVSGAFAVATGILTESALSFLGFGVNEPVPSWGALVNDSRNPEHWWVILFPGLLIFVTVSCYNLVGDAIRDAVDPRLKD